LITKEYGSAIRLISVLTNAELPVDKPIIKSYCGNCRNYVEKCSAKAPLGLNWKPELNRSDFYNAFDCKEKATELAGKINLNCVICGICIRYCPWTAKYLNKSKTSFKSK
jgi:epoxyqueuosine reductase QueG